MLPENDFINRHIGPRKKETQAMLDSLGLKNIDELINKTIPKDILINEDLNECYNEIIGYLENSLEYNKSLIEKHVKKLI